MYETFYVTPLGPIRILLHYESQSVAKQNGPFLFFSEKRQRCIFSCRCKLIFARSPGVNALSVIEKCIHACMLSVVGDLLAEKGGQKSSKKFIYRREQA